MITEIVVGTNKLSLPEPWQWQQSKSGRWYAINDVMETIISADLRGDEGLHVLVEAQDLTYVPAIVIALVVLANDSGTFNNMIPKLSNYVTHMPEIEEIHDAD